MPSKEFKKTRSDVKNLEPNVEIPANEKWLWENKLALQQVKKGLVDSADGKIKLKR